MRTPHRTGATREGGAEGVRHDVPRSAAAVEWAVPSGRSVGAPHFYGARVSSASDLSRI